MVASDKVRGRFITFEGGEGAGKSTQIRMLAARLREAGRDVLETREPGGSPGAEAVRHVLLSGAAEAFGTRMEAVLFAAARNDHVEQLIRPALAEGRVVLCDRFIDSTRVYQGATGNLEPEFIQTLERIAINGLMPDLTIVLDLPAEQGLARVDGRSRAAADAPDRFEREELAVHEIRRRAYLDLAEREPKRIRVIDGSRAAEAVAADIAALVEDSLAAGEAKPAKVRTRRRAGR